MKWYLHVLRHLYYLQGKVSVGDQGLVNEASCRRGEAFFGPYGPQPPARGESLNQFVSRVGGVSCNLPCSPPSPGGMQFLEKRKTAANHPLCKVNDMLQPALVPDGGSIVPDGDGGGENGLCDGGVEVQHCYWQAELLQLPQEVHSLVSLLGEAGDVQLPLAGAQETKGDHNGNWRVTQDDGDGWSCALSEVHDHLHCFQSVELRTILAADGQSPSCRQTHPPQR
ncbi:hypothetical protein ILYODFUR_018925 [Ilyodon furcidens]|uniref:Uncharacterized protein n=1 Tax=Ilyodon furcidens TaxID=33524 RepID=A0ABV0UW41_9TELE